ncbi:MAG TPA: RCC1 domain-containing protein [Polyangiaceae bacterium]|nr:RCC1 domain-containing protein [Polyangiaceae bacterium]
MLSGSSDTSCALLQDERTICWRDRGASFPLPEPEEAPWASAAGARKNRAAAKTVAVSPGGLFDCVLASTGAVGCWGSSFYFPVPASALFTPRLSKPVQLAGKATIVSSGESHACAGLEQGGMQCWGTGTDGKLGYGDNKWHAQPPKFPVLLANHRVVSVAAGYESTCAVLSDGTARCWGRAQDGRCYGCEADGSAPPGSLTSADSTFAISFERPIRDIALGRDAACVILEGGELRCCRTVRVSEGLGAKESTGWSSDATLPSDGRMVVFKSTSRNLVEAPDGESPRPPTKEPSLFVADLEHAWDEE